jgi:hypothetical protein
MRSAGNFHPQWGYLAPAPSFLRTARTVVVATAVGATAGAAVVLSLLDRSEVDTAHTSVAAHALVTSAAEVDAPPPVASVANSPASAPSSQLQGSTSAPVNAATPIQPQTQTDAAKPTPPASDPSNPRGASNVASGSTPPTPQAPASVPALAAATPAAVDPAKPTAAPEAKKVGRKRFAPAHYAQRGEPPRRNGWGPLWPRFFTSQSSPSYPNYRGL